MSRTPKDVRGPTPSTVRKATLETLTLLVQDYQRKHRAEELAALNPTEILHHLMDESGMTVTDLGEVIGSRTAASMIVNGRRSPSKVHILRLAERFGVDPVLFLAEGYGPARRKSLPDVR